MAPYILLVELVVYVTEEGKAPFDDWFTKLDTAAALKVRTALARIETGILELFEVKGFGFSDLMIRQAARRAGADVLMTFDRKAARLDGVDLVNNEAS